MASTSKEGIIPQKLLFLILSLSAGELLGRTGPMRPISLILYACTFEQSNVYIHILLCVI